MLIHVLRSLAVIVAGAVALPAQDVGIRAVSSADGRLEIFVRGSGSWINHAWQTQVEAGTAATHWAWNKTDVGLGGSDFAAGRDAQGRLVVAAVQNGIISVNGAPAPGASFGTASKLPTQDVHGLALSASADGRLELFSLSNTGVAWTTAETGLGNRSFANHNLSGTKLRSLAPAPYADGRLGLVALGGDYSVWFTSQTMPNGDWTGWSSLQGHDIRAVAAAAMADGRLFVVALGASRALYMRAQDGSGGWTPWQTLAAGPFAAPLYIARNADGRLEVFVHRDDQYRQIEHGWQTDVKGGWTDFSVLANIPRYTHDFAVTSMPDGRLVVAAAGSGGGTYPEVFVAGQAVPNGAWETWGHPPTEPPPGPPKPRIDAFAADNGNGYAPIGTTFTFSWDVGNCGSSCHVALTGLTGAHYNTVFFSVPEAGAHNQAKVKPSDTNTLFKLTASGPGGTDSETIEVKLMPAPTAPTCANCQNFFFKMVPPSTLLPCAKKLYYAPDAATAESWAKAEFPGWTVTKITDQQFQAYGC